MVATHETMVFSRKHRAIDALMDAMASMHQRDMELLVDMAKHMPDDPAYPVNITWSVSKGWETS